MKRGFPTREDQIDRRRERAEKGEFRIRNMGGDPVFSIFELGFYDWDGITPDARQWVGLENYKKLVTQDFAFRHSIRNNVL